MAISNYTELQTAVSNWMHRGDLTARIPEFITMGEAMLNRKLRSIYQLEHVNINPSTTDTYVSLPAGFKRVISFVDDQGDKLTPLSMDKLEYESYGIGSGRPEYYCITSRINFERVAGASYDYPMVYFKALDIATDVTNDLLTNMPDVYLWASLMGAEQYIKADQRLAVIKTLLDEAIMDMNNQAREAYKSPMRTDLSGRSFNIITG